MQSQALCPGCGLDPSQPPKPPVSPFTSGQIATPTQPAVVAPNHHQLQRKSSEPPFGSAMHNPISQVSTAEGTSVGNSAANESLTVNQG
ncbi:hypothetical protein KIW84_064541 [Lathyrus oleraceus]|uniref:Uncharacterized protein n=1 Tax=Pisum sativum TaxID=3888 RepID=A0A9D4WEL7_PEA|nr:hypothetical protein KIW84_064541 [Pisum sativum]